jgi:hypothetical protein
MIIATRTLSYRNGANDIAIAVSIHAPVEADRCWECRFEIDWPSGKITQIVRGFDGVQALYLTMQRIALELYGSAYHQAGTLLWQKAGTGYGFPAMKSSYGDLIGEDRLDQVPD